ncbi:MAG: ArsC family transcriptional regulator [Oscillospiraceae bacterium]|nr:ArsC family transcriptional regulator [Oscillospiraceae bacterium]
MPIIQIFGKSKCFDTKKAERFFKERGVKVQNIDLPRYGISRGELQSVVKAVGGLEKLLNDKHPDAANVSYLAHEEDKIEALLDYPALLRTPIVRNGKMATVGVNIEIWGTWL